MTTPASPGAPRAERAYATVMFADIVGFTALSERMGPERAYLIVTECLKRLDGCAREYGGAVDKYMGDCLMAVFGHPVPLEQHPLAAVEAALAMRDVVRDYVRDLELEVPLDIHIGLNTGPLVSGDLRGRAIREFHVLGDSVNVAARLKGRCPVGRIYVGEETERATKDRFAYAPLEPLQLKGKGGLVRAFELTSEAQARSADEAGDGVATPWIGRAEELGRLRALVTGLRERGGAVVLLTGEEGIGKSRLLRELHASEEGSAVRWVALEGEVPRFGVGGDARQVVVVDDLQQLSEASLDRLESLLEHVAGQPTLFLLAARSGASQATEQFLERQRARLGERWEELELGPLSDDESAELLASLVDADAPAPDVGSLIRARARGNPRRLILGAFLAPALRSERDRARGGDERSADTERRRATVLFADITGFTSLTETLGDADAYTIVTQALERLDEVARTYGGTVDKYLGDCVMALFGVPRAIEDAPRAAINAALEMRQSILALNREHSLDGLLDVHSGINTGVAISGDVSGPLIREFALMGDPVDVADQLKDAAPSGHVRVGEETHRFARDVFEFEPVEPVILSGRAREIAAYELRSDRPELHRRRAGAARELFSELVGREAEVRELRRLMAATAEGQGAIASIVGEAGLGKSRLLAELRRSDEARHVLWLEGRSLSVGQQLSFHPFGDLLRSWAGVRDEDEEADVPAKLSAALESVFGAETATVFPFFASLMGLPLSDVDRERLDAVPGDTLAKVLAGNVTELLRRLSAERPLVLVFDDLHWADLSSIELLESLLRLVERFPVLIVNVFRSGYEATSERIRSAARERLGERAVELELGPLGEDACRGLINNLFQQADIPFDLRRRIVERSSGNPLFVEEVVRSLLEEGALERDERGFRATEKIHDAIIPGTVDEVIMARFDRLEQRQKDLLRVAAVIGGSFHEEVLQRIFEDDAQRAQVLAALQDAQFIVPWDRLQGVEYAFKSPLVHEVVYGGMLESVREELHLRVGAAVEGAFNESFPGYAAMLAYHFSLGGDEDQAEEWLFRAGDEAAQSAASNEALHFFREASNLYFELRGQDEDPHKRFLLEKNLAMALYNRGLPEESYEHFDAALEYRGHRVLHHRLGLQLRMVRDLALVLLRLYLPRALLRRRPASEDDRELLNLMSRRSRVQGTLDPLRASSDSLAALRWGAGLKPETVPDAATLYASAAGFFSLSGISLSAGGRILDLAKELADLRGGAQDILYRYANFAHHFIAGDWSRDHEIEGSTLEAGMRSGRLFEVSQYTGLVGDKFLRQGRFDDATACIERMDQVWDLYQYPPARVGGYILRMLQAHQRRLAETLEAADVYSQESDQDALRVHALGHKAEVQVALGDLEGAGETLARAEALLKTGSRPPPYHLSAYATARLLYDVERLESAAAPDPPARKALVQAVHKSGNIALKLSRRLGYREPEVLRLLGRRDWLLGRFKPAAECWRRSLATAERLEMQPALARTLAEIGVRLGGTTGPDTLDGRRGEAYLDEARPVFRALALDQDLEWIAQYSN